jgi:hypothetical protein
VISCVGTVRALLAVFGASSPASTSSIVEASHSRTRSSLVLESLKDREAAGRVDAPVARMLRRAGSAVCLP